MIMMMSTVNKVALITVAAVLALAATDSECLAVGDELVEPESLVARLDQEQLDLDKAFEKTIKEQYFVYLSAADKMLAKRPGKDGLILRQMANLFAKIEQIKFASQHFGLRVAKRILQEQFLQDSDITGDLRLETKHALLLVQRSKLRSLVDAYRYGDEQWRELYTIIEKAVPVDQASLYYELHQLAQQAHLARFELQKSATNAYLKEQELLEQIGANNKAGLLAKLDSVIDETTKCEPCIQLQSQKDETNFFTYPLDSEQGIKSMVGHVDGLEASYRETKAKLPVKITGQPDELNKVDEEDIGLQGMEFLEKAGVSFDF